VKAVELKKGIYWVGAVDWNVRDFHGYSTYKGTTYNSYLMVDDKITLFDTVKKEYFPTMMHHISQIVDPSKIDYLVVNHVEPDHSGSIPLLMEMVKPEKVYCSEIGEKALLGHFHNQSWPLQPVKNGEQITLGKRKIVFLETRMLHWPDSMFSFLPEEKLLISHDAFGEHLASSARFADEVDLNLILPQAGKYYANILWPYSPLVQRLLQTIKDMKLEIDMIAPDHGVIWRKDLNVIIDAYDRWSSYQTRNKALVVYETMWKSTEEMAKYIVQGLSDSGVEEVMQMYLGVNHRSEVIAELLEAKAIILGSPTLNNNMMPRLADYITYMKGLRPGGKLAACFGSYGWSGEAVKIMNKQLKEANIELLDETGIRHQWVPDKDALQNCYNLGIKAGQAIQR
jgi:flavorubredoxin